MGLASALIRPVAKSIVKKVDDVAPKVIGEMLEESAPVATKSISGVVDSPLVTPRLDRTADLGVEPPLIAEAGKDAFEALGMTAEKKESWRSVNKKSQRSKLLPEIEDAAQQLSENKITSEQFRQLSKDKQPIVPLDKVPEMPAYEDISGALTDSQVKKGIVGLNLKIPAGERVSSRLDIPAYNDYDTWVVSLHDGSKKSGAAVGYAKTAVLRNVEFVSDPKVALDIARRKPLASGGRMGKATIARIFGDWVPHNPDNAKTFAEKIFKDPEWTQVGMNPYRASYFYDKADGLPVTSADEIVQIGPLVMAKNVKKTTPDAPMFKINQKEPTSPTFAEGGAVEQTSSMLADGGIMQEGGTVDPVSGNDVPIGSLKEEVRDDIDAKLSEGEFVIPADVVRYIGLEKLMKIRDAAKQGLARMEEVGQMGNAEEAPKADEAFAENDDEFNNSIDEIMSEVDNEEQMPKMAAGGVVSGAYKEGMKFNPVVDVRYFKHPDGRVIYITYINDKPMIAIPEGFTQTDKPVEQKIGKEAEDAAAATAAAAARAGGVRVENSDGASVGTGDQPGAGAVPSFDAEGRAVAATTGMSKGVAQGIGTVAGLVTGFPALGFLMGWANERANQGYAKDAAAVNQGISDTMGSNFGNYGFPDSPTATTGPSGTGGAASTAGAAAAAAATAAGYSPSTIGVAAQAAVDATLSGATPSQAAEAGKEAGAKSESNDRAEIGKGEVAAVSVAASGDYSGGQTQPSGEAYANYKGGFIKKKTKPAVKSKKGLASR